MDNLNRRSAVPGQEAFERIIKEKYPQLSLNMTSRFSYIDHEVASMWLGYKEAQSVQEKEVTHWKANHEDLKNRLRVATHRTDIQDMEVVKERLKLYDHLTIRIAELEQQNQVYRTAMLDQMKANGAEIEGSAQEPCTTCGGAVSVHSPDGEYRGECPFCSEVEKLRSQLKEAINRINDMLVSDDGQAHKEARKFVEMHQQDLASKGVSDV